jgi:branched-chain amino acid transport system substrate-binding protein
LETFQPAGGVVEGAPFYTPYVPTPSMDFVPFLTQIRKSDATAVFCFYAGALAVAFVKQYRQLGLTQTLYSVGSLTEGGTLQAEGAEAAGIYTAFNYSADLDIPANRTFATAYQRTYRSAPSTYAMAAFDAAAVLDRAITLTGADLTSASLNASIGRVGQVNSPRGPWEFGKGRTPLQKWYLRQVRMDGSVLSNVVIAELLVL